jgi:hypothetical protein
MNDFIAVLEEQLITAHRERRPRRRPIPWRGGAVVIAAAVTIAAVVAVVIALASPDTHRAGSGPQQQQSPPQTTPVRPSPRTTVAVLNGTTVTGLARVAADTLVANGFREGVVTNDTTNQQRARTVIYYEPGYKEQAQTVAGCIGSGLDLIRPMTATARVAADRAPIAVFVGADLAQ